MRSINFASARACLTAFFINLLAVDTPVPTRANLQLQQGHQANLDLASLQILQVQKE